MLHSQGLLRRDSIVMVEQLHRILQWYLAFYVLYMQMMVQVVIATHNIFEDNFRSFLKSRQMIEYFSLFCF